MKIDFYEPLRRIPSKQYWIAIGVLCAVAILPAARNFAEQVALRGLIYISPSGKPVGDLVVYPSNLDILLVGDVEKFNMALEEIRKSRKLTIEKQMDTVSRVQQEFLRASRNREEQAKKGVILKQERVRLAELREAYEKEVSELIEKFTVAKTKTATGGKFSFSNTADGKFLVHAQYEILAMAIRYQWLVPVELKKGQETEVTLTKLNATDLF